MSLTTATGRDPQNRNTLGFTAPSRKAAARTPMSRTRSTRIGDWLVFVLLSAGAIVMVAPLIWMVSTSLKTKTEVFALPPVWIPEVPQWDTYVRMWQDSSILTGFQNSFIVAGTVTVLGTITCSMAAFAIAKMRLPFSNLIFVGLLTGIMIPYPTLMIPQFVMFSRIGWVDTLLPLIVPAIFGNILVIFFLRQYRRTCRTRSSRRPRSTARTSGRSSGG
jgi:multiple sugar transport system permease protein